GIDLLALARQLLCARFLVAVGLLLVLRSGLFTGLLAALFTRLLTALLAALLAGLTARLFARLLTTLRAVRLRWGLLAGAGGSCTGGSCIGHGCSICDFTCGFRHGRGGRLRALPLACAARLR